MCKRVHALNENMNRATSGGIFSALSLRELYSAPRVSSDVCPLCSVLKYGASNGENMDDKYI